MAALREAGLAVGDVVVASVEGPGRVVLQREVDVVAAFAGSLPDAYHDDELDQLRDEWD